MKYIVVLPRERAYFRTIDGDFLPTKLFARADRYSLDSANKIAVERNGVVVDEFGQPVPNRKGTAAVELALVLPLFVSLLLGALEIGRAFQCQQKLTNISYGIARYVTSNASQAEIDTYTVKALNEAGIRGASVTVKGALQGDTVTVTLSVPIERVGWLPPRLFSRTLVAASTLRRE